MAIGTTLGGLIDMVRLEARLSTASSRGVEDKDRLIHMINRVYETLWDEHEWEVRRISRENCYKTLQAGQRFYDFPSTIRPQDITSVWLRWGNTWREVNYGITFAHYGQFDSERDERSEPVQQWVMRSEEQFEVWPLPASNGVALGTGVLGFEGKKKFIKLLDEDTDNCLLDDYLISLFVAYEILAANKQGDADAKNEQARARLSALSAKNSDRTSVRVGLGTPTSPQAGYPRLTVAYVRN